MGCQNNYLHVPKDIWRKLFFFEKKLIVLKFGNWAKKNLAVSSIFFLRAWQGWILPVRKNQLKKTFYKEKVFSFNMFGRRTKQFRPPWQFFSQRCQNIVLRVHNNNLRKLLSENLQKFQFLLAIGQNFSWTKQGKGIAKFCRKPLSPVKIYWGGPFDVFKSLLIRKTKRREGITIFLLKFVVPQ